MGIEMAGETVEASRVGGSQGHDDVVVGQALEEALTLRCVEDHARVLGHALHGLVQGARVLLGVDERSIDPQDIRGAHRLDGLRPHAGHLRGDVGGRRDGQSPAVVRGEDEPVSVIDPRQPWACVDDVLAS